jgi:hypothetical protein
MRYHTTNLRLIVVTLDDHGVIESAELFPDPPAGARAFSNACAAGQVAVLLTADPTGHVRVVGTSIISYEHWSEDVLREVVRRAAELVRPGGGSSGQPT